MFQDKELERRFAKGDAAALEQLFIRDHEFLAEAAAGILPPRVSPTSEYCVGILWGRLRRGHQKCKNDDEDYDGTQPFRVWVVDLLRQVIVECRFGGGDNDALGELFVRDHTWLVAQATKFQKPGLAPTPEDFVVDVWMKLTKKLGASKYDCETPFQAWVKVVLFNLIRERARRKGDWAWDRIVSVLQNLRPSEKDAQMQRKLLHLVHNAEVRQDVDSEKVAFCLARLSPELRMALILRFFRDLKFREMAEETDLPQGTWVTRVRTACRLLKECLQRGRAFPND